MTYEYVFLNVEDAKTEIYYDLTPEEIGDILKRGLVLIEVSFPEKELNKRIDEVWHKYMNLGLHGGSKDEMDQLKSEYDALNSELDELHKKIDHFKRVW